MMLFNGLKTIRYKVRCLWLKLFGKTGLYYINGSESLPPPLATEIEEKLVLEIDKPEARQTLIEHNLRLVAYIAKRFENTGANIE